MGRSASSGALIGLLVLTAASQGCDVSISASEGEVILGFDGDASLEDFLEVSEGDASDRGADARDAAAGSAAAPSSEDRAGSTRVEGGALSAPPSPPR